MVSNYSRLASSVATAFFILLITHAHAQRERLQTPDPINEFNLLEKQLINANENDSLLVFYPLLDSVHLYTITFSTLGRNFKGFYIYPKHGYNLPGILYNLSDDVDELHFDHSAALRLASNAPRGHAYIISFYYDQNSQPDMRSDSCKERNVITNVLDHIHLFPEIDPTSVFIREAPNP